MSSDYQTQVVRERLTSLTEQLTRLQTPLARDVVRTNWLIGRTINDNRVHFESAIQLATAWGVDLDELLAESLSSEAPLIRNAMRFAREYDEETLDELIGVGLSWNHICELLVVPQGSRRQQLLDRVTSERMNPYQLHQEIHRIYGLDDKRSTRSSKTPMTLGDGLQRVESGVRRFRENVFKLVFGDGFNLPAVVRCMPTVDVEATRPAIERASRALRRAATEAIQRAEELDAVLADQTRIAKGGPQSLVGQPRRTRLKPAPAEPAE